MRISLAIADYTYRCGIHDSLSPVKTYIIICTRIRQTVSDSANFVAASAKMHVFREILSKTVFKLFVSGNQNIEKDRKAAKLRIQQQI